MNILIINSRTPLLAFTLGLEACFSPLLSEVVDFLTIFRALGGATSTAFSTQLLALSSSNFSNLLSTAFT